MDHGVVECGQPRQVQDGVWQELFIGPSNKIASVRNWRIVATA
jgi:hypothetical protein